MSREGTRGPSSDGAPGDGTADGTAGPVDGASVPAIDLDGVAVDLGGQRVLADVTATVPRGAFVGLVGPNGAGKTTLLRTINGALDPAAGAVRIEGRRVSGLSSRATSRLIATVPQSPSLSFDFSVREVVEMGRTPHLSRFGGMDAGDREAVERAMARAQVADLADRPITEVSGGERSRVLLARALAQDAPVLALDEPTASLDINHQLRTLRLTRDLVAEGRTAVAAIHDLDLAARFCDRLLVLADGAVLAAGPPAEVLTASTVERAFDTAAAVSRAPETGARRVTALPDRDGDADGHVHVFGGGGRATRFLHALAAAGYDLSVGPLHEGDADAETARRLGADLTTVPPFAGVDAAARETVRERLAAADAVLAVDVPVSDGNRSCLADAGSTAPVVLVEERPLAERNHAGAAGRRCYERLREAGAVVAPEGEVLTPEGVLAAVADAVAAEAPRLTADD